MARSSGVIRYALSQLRRDRSGAVAVITALSFTSLLGLAGLATEASFWYVKKRDMQGAADSASYSAAVAVAAGESGGTSGSATLLASAIAAQYGFSSGVTVNNPPLSGNFTCANDPSGCSTAFEVIVAQTQTPLLSSYFLSPFPISARAVAAEQTNGSGNGCVLALDTGSLIDVSDSGAAALNINNCSIYVNSDDAHGALTMSGAAIINAYSAYIVGGTNISGAAALNTSHGTYTGTSPISDPYAGTPIPSLSSCSGNYPPITSASNGGNPTNLTPGQYCGGLNVSGGATVNLAPGVYVMDGGSFNISGGSTINGTGGVTIILTGTATGGYATVNISGGTNINITAPTSGTYSGLAFYQDPNAPSTGTNSFSGGANQDITGAIYFPHQQVNFSGGTATGGSQCTQLIANTISISGGTTFNNNCTNAGTKTIGGSTTIQLVE